jgi:hypothetical protein
VGLSFDGFELGQGSLKEGFRFDIKTVPGRHELAVKIPIRGAKTYQLSFRKPGHYSVQLQYSRNSGTFANTCDVVDMAHYPTEGDEKGVSTDDDLLPELDELGIVEDDELLAADVFTSEDEDAGFQFPIDLEDEGDLGQECNIACPHCGGAILNDGSLAHRFVRCPHCDKKLQMTGPLD